MNASDNIDAMLEAKLQEHIQKWAHPELLGIWMILNTPEWEDGEMVLREYDIENIGLAIMKINRDFNHPEIKALRQRLANDDRQ